MSGVQWSKISQLFLSFSCTKSLVDFIAISEYQPHLLLNLYLYFLTHCCKNIRTEMPTPWNFVMETKSKY